MSQDDYNDSYGDEEDIQQLNPDDLVSGFAKTNFIRFLLISVVLHVIIIGGSSVGFFLHAMNPPSEEPAEAGDDAETDATADDEAEPADAADAKSAEATRATMIPVRTTTAKQPTMQQQPIRRLNGVIKRSKNIMKKRRQLMTQRTFLTLKASNKTMHPMARPQFGLSA